MLTPTCNPAFLIHFLHMSAVFGQGMVCTLARHRQNKLNISSRSLLVSEKLGQVQLFKLANLLAQVQFTAILSSILESVQEWFCTKVSCSALTVCHRYIKCLGAPQVNYARIQLRYRRLVWKLKGFFFTWTTKNWRKLVWIRSKQRIKFLARLTIRQIGTRHTFIWFRVFYVRICVINLRLDWFCLNLWML